MVKATITAGMRFRSGEVLSVDPTGKRAVIACCCGGTHIVGIEALLNDALACSAISWTPEQIARHREEKRQQRRARDLRKAWRP